MFGFLKKKTSLTDHNLMHGAGRPDAKAVDISGFNKVINFCLYALVLLTPLLFLPWTSEVLEFNKQMVVFFLTMLMLGVWVIKILTTRKVSWVKTSLDYILLIYLGVYLLTSLFSLDKVSSFLGYYGRFTGSFVSVLALIVMYFLLVNNLKSERTVRKITHYYLFSSGVVLVYSFLQLMGWYILPAGITHVRTFNPIGSLVGLAIYAAISVVFIQWLWFSEKPSKLKGLSLALLTLVSLGILLIVNAFVAWAVLALAMVAFLAISLAVAGQDQTSATWFWKPMLVLVISVLFVSFQFLPPVLNPRNLVSVDLPVEIQLSNSTTWHLVGNSFKHGAKNAILGSGPGTTGIAFGTIKPTDLNKTIVWSLTFDRASSEIGNIAIESGLLGLLVFELISILFLFYGLFFLLKRSEHVGWKYAFGFFLIFLSLYVTHFFYFFNTTFYFMYWFSIGLFMAIAHQTSGADENSEVSFASSPRSALSWMFVSLLMLAALLVGTFFEAAQYGGEVAYAAGLRGLNQTQPDFAKVSNDFGRALTLNPYRDSYFLAYGQNLIFQASEEASKPQPDQTKIQNWMSDLITAGQKAVSLSPNKSSNWAALAQFYANIKPLASNADQYVIQNLKTAIEHDPNNPALHYQLGQAYVSASTVPDTSLTQGTDTDQDGLTDALEAKLGSDPQKADSNGNEIADGAEVQSGLNPTNGARLTAEQINSFSKTDPEMVKLSMAEFNKAIELKNDLPEFYIQLARVQQRSNNLDDAKKTIENGISHVSANADLLFEEGVVVYNQKNYTEAQTIFQNVIVLSPEHANAHYSLGLTYQQLGNKPKALAEFQKARDISGPNDDLDALIKSLQ